MRKVEIYYTNSGDGYSRLVCHVVDSETGQIIRDMSADLGMFRKDIKRSELFSRIFYALMEDMPVGPLVYDMAKCLHPNVETIWTEKLANTSS